MTKPSDWYTEGKRGSRLTPDAEMGVNGLARSSRAIWNNAIRVIGSDLDDAGYADLQPARLMLIEAYHKACAAGLLTSTRLFWGRGDD